MQLNQIKQKDLLEWTSLDQLIIICGQYEGFDERIRFLADDEISLGDFVLSGGEIPAMSIINGLTRLLPGTLGDPFSLKDESHNSSLLEYPHYTRPFIFRNMEVPSILISGNHEEIKLWREEQMQKAHRIYQSNQPVASTNRVNIQSLLVPHTHTHTPVRIFCRDNFLRFPL